MPTISPAQSEQLSSIPLNSPLSVVGAFIYLVRKRFNVDSGLPWIWVDGRATTGIVIEAQYNKDLNIKDGRPGVFIDKSQTVYGQTVIGDRDQDQPRIVQTGLEHFISTGQTDINIDCVSTKKGESAYIGDVVQNYIHMTSKIFKRYFSFRDISPVLLNQTAEYAEQENLYNTAVNFRVEYEVRWATVPVTPVLKELTLQIDPGDSGGTSPVRPNVDVYLTNLYLDSLNGTR